MSTPLTTGDAVAAALQLPAATPAMTECAAVADQLIRPYVTAEGLADPLPAPVTEAAVHLAIDVWQARTAAGGQSVGIDGNPGPYRMGRSVLDRVTGLLGPWLDQRSELG